jgi:acetolactate synthase regulatory subunit
MTSTLELRLRRAEGSLLRVLVAVRRLGFETTALAALTTDDGLCVDVVMTVDSTRSADNLVRQLTKLHDTLEVRRKEAVAPESVPLAPKATSTGGSSSDGPVGRTLGGMLHAMGPST